MLKKATAFLNPASRAAALGIAAFVAAISATRPALAADVTFPAAGGGTADLASAAAWNLEAVPDASTRVVFTKAMTATASEDISFAGIYMNAYRSTVTLDMRDETTGASPRKIDLTSAITFKGVEKQVLRLKGGEWDMHGKSVTIFANSDYGNSAGSRIELLDGIRMYNVANLRGGWWPDGKHRITIAGAGTAVTAGVFQVAAGGGVTNVATIADGATLVVTNSANGSLSIDKPDTSGNQAKFSGIFVTNGARLLKNVGGQIYLGRHAAVGNFLRVESGATAYLDGVFHFAYSEEGTTANSSRDNLISVSGTGSNLRIPGLMLGYGGASSGNSNNVVSVSDGAVLTNAYTSLRGHDNGFVISNATMRTTNGGIECRADSLGTATNCFVRLQGAAPRLTVDGSSRPCTFSGSFRFEYDIPAEGYSSTPVTLNQWATMAANTEFVINGVPELQESMRKREVKSASYPLLKANAGLNTSGPSASIASRCNTRLPEGASLSYANNTFTLNVEVDLKRATTIVFR